MKYFISTGEVSGEMHASYIVKEMLKKESNLKFYAAGGENLKAARANAYKATEWIDFANKYKRNDIGKAIDEA
jgi:lipid A disaccharide synthetase